MSLFLGMSTRLGDAGRWRGAEGIRTPDLRRAKSGPYRRGDSPLFRTSRKMAYFLYERLASVRLSSRGWCTTGVRTPKSNAK